MSAVAQRVDQNVGEASAEEVACAFLARRAKARMTPEVAAALVSGRFNERLDYELEVMFKRIELLARR